jgi:CMP-N,N'-diacetyllegionaminic acid synthase
MKKKRNINYDIVCDLDVTAPLRLVFDILSAYKVFIKNNYPNLISVNYQRRNLYFNMVEFKNMKLQISKSQQKYTTRQQVLKVQA